jgi:hypothetical protein
LAARLERGSARRRRILLARGQQTLSVRAALPGSDAEYVMATYEAARYWPVGATWTFDLRGNVGLGVAYGATPSLPPYQNFFAGGPNTVRGFRGGGLGRVIRSAVHMAAICSPPFNSRRWPRGRRAGVTECGSASSTTSATCSPRRT